MYDKKKCVRREKYNPALYSNKKKKKILGNRDEDNFHFKEGVEGTAVNGLDTNRQNIFSWDIPMCV